MIGQPDHKTVNFMSRNINYARFKSLRAVASRRFEGSWKYLETSVRH
jgi:hypothetical protein